MLSICLSMKTRLQDTVRYPLLLIATYVLSRLLFYFMGVRFDAAGLDWYWQYLDVELLKNDLARSVFYQHAQPPLFNLFLGTVLKLFPNAYATAFAFIFKALSLMLYDSLYRTLHLVGLRRWTAYLFATLFMLSPGAVLYENWLFYTWPAAALLTLSAHQLLLYEKKRRTQNALLYLAGLTAVCLMRSMFHLVYLAAATVPLLLIASPARKRIIPAAGMALLLVGAVFLKNLLLFGFFGSSSWMGMNLWKVAPVGGKQQQLGNSAVAMVEPFSAITNYPSAFQTVPARFSEIPALADAFKQNGQPNLNHVGYIAVSEAYKQKAVGLIAGDLPGYAGIVMKAWRNYFTPARHYFLLNPSNHAVLKPLAIPGDAFLLVPAGLLLMLAGLTKRPDAFYLFCAGTVLYIALIGNGLEHGENMRFRVQTDPLLYLAAIHMALRLFSQNRSAAEKI